MYHIIGLVKRVRNVEAVKGLDFFLIKRVGMEPRLFLRHAERRPILLRPFQRERNIRSKISTMDP